MNEILIIIGIILIIYTIYNLYNTLSSFNDNFMNINKNNNIILEVDNKFVRYDNGKLCITPDINMATKFSLSIFDKKYLTLYTKINGEKLYVNNTDGKLKLSKYNYIYHENYKILFEEKTNGNILFINRKYIMLKDDCLILTDKKSQASTIIAK